MCKSEMAYAVYLCGPTDCFLHAIFVDKHKADVFAATYGSKADGWRVVELPYHEATSALEEG